MTNINFIGNSKKYFGLSIVLVAVVLICSFVLDVQLDIQFKGGSIITYSYEGDMVAADFAAKADELLGGGVSYQENTGELAGTGKTVILTLPGVRSLKSEELVAVTDSLRESFPENNPQTISISNVDPTIGGEFLAKCLTAVFFASILMVVYIAFRFRKIGGLSAGVMAVVALMHDVVIVFGTFVLLHMPLNDNFIAVVLTILGYSLNDTIVVYDRIRENRRLMGSKAQIGELVNRSINQSFRRSMNTSITTAMAMVIVTVVAYLSNVTSILSFSIPMIFGLVSGTYSSICIAGPLWVKWQERKLEGKPA